MSEASFEKHVYGKERKHQYVPMENFDPRPVPYRGTAKKTIYTLCLTKSMGKDFVFLFCLIQLHVTATLVTYQMHLLQRYLQSKNFERQLHISNKVYNLQMRKSVN
jgi:hypothetical protein